MSRYTYNGNFINFEEAYNKLADLEDLEEKLGVSIIKVFEALENGAWVKSKEWGLCKWNMPNIFNEYDGRNNPKSNPELQFLKSGKYKYFKLKDYGKTWALTREELE